MAELTEFEALDYHDFAQMFLCEDNGIKGKLSQRASEINRENTQDANRWATEIFNDVRRGLEDIAKAMAKKGVPVDLLPSHNDASSEHKIYDLNGHQVELKIYRIGSWANEEVPIVDVVLSSRRKIEINIYDDESIMVKISPVLARHSGLDPIRVIRQIERVGVYVNGIVEKQVWR